MGAFNIPSEAEEEYGDWKFHEDRDRALESGGPLPDCWCGRQSSMATRERSACCLEHLKGPR